MYETALPVLHYKDILNLYVKTFFLFIGSLIKLILIENYQLGV